MLIQQAISVIKGSGLVAFPTETVYGLGADATCSAAVSKIFQIKNRPLINPLIIHVASIEQAEAIGVFNQDAYALSKLWPGPLTIIMPLNRAASIASAALAGLTTVALRIPAHPIALELITESGTSLAAPSANPSGYISPTRYQHVEEHFNQEDSGVLTLRDPVKCQYGLESTIISVTDEAPVILRSGFIGRQLLESILGKKVASAVPSSLISAPGLLGKHYSPSVAMRLEALNLLDCEVGLNFGQSRLEGNFSLNLSKQGDLIKAARNLYSDLRKLDNYAVLNSFKAIAVAPIPLTGLGIAINDRLKRAATS